MSLSDVISRELAGKLSDLSVADFQALARAGSLQLGPKALHDGVKALARGEDATLPLGGGQPRPIKILAWSFLKDHGQFHDAYGLTSARAGELTDLLRSDREKAVAEIATIVTAALRKKGSPRPVSVSLEGMPGVPATDHSSRSIAGGTRASFKEEIRRDPAYYGMFSCTVEDTGRSGAQRYRAKLGGGLYATHGSKVGAIDVFRICRKHGRAHELIVDNVAFWLEGREPLFGDSIPSKVIFDGRLSPNADPPSEPVGKSKTVSSPPDE